MCLYGNYRLVDIIHPQQKKVVIDACIADEIQRLNDKGVKTIGCCCGHGKAGQIEEYSNGFGSWKERNFPPHALIFKESADIAKKLGYIPFPYVYADGSDNGVLIMHLKSGCITESECADWHRLNEVEYKRNQGIIE